MQHQKTCGHHHHRLLDTRIAPKKGGPMIFDKSTGEISLLKKYPPCPPDTLSRRFIINDIDGIVNPGPISSENGQFVLSHQIIDSKDRLKENCVVARNIKFPGKRQEMTALVKSSKDDDNPVLQIFHLKLWGEGGEVDHKKGKPTRTLPNGNCILLNLCILEMCYIREG